MAVTAEELKAKLYEYAEAAHPDWVEAWIQIGRGNREYSETMYLARNSTVIESFLKRLGNGDTKKGLNMIMMHEAKKCTNEI